MRIELLGASFQIQSDERPEYIEELLAHYRDRIDQIERSVATGDPLKKAILAALLVTDELFTERNRASEAEGRPLKPDDAAEIEEITTRLLSRLEESLPPAAED